ncbi:MAG: hypothetical protein AABY22_14645 [Nanoarchaeota archaeon]
MEHATDSQGLCKIIIDKLILHGAEIGNSCEILINEIVTKALLDAYEAGRKEELEEAYIREGDKNE